MPCSHAFVLQMSIIEILIENYPQIFEDHSESLPSESWGDSSTSSGNSTNHEIIMWNPENGTGENSLNRELRADTLDFLDNFNWLC